MFVKITLVVVLLQICVAVDPTDHQSHTKQAVSSQSFVRHDVPLSYKYSAVHIYTTQKPNPYGHEQFSHHHQNQNQPPKAIQYAPIYNTQHDLNSAYDNHKAAEFRPEKDEISVVKDNSEQKPQELQNLRHMSDFRYLPAKNVELSHTLNRFPVHNDVYRSYPNTANSEKINKVNYLNQYALHQKPEEYVTPIQSGRDTAQTEEAEQLQATFAPFVPRQKHYHHHQPQQHQVPSSFVQKPQLYNSAHVFVNAVPSPQAIFQLRELIPHAKAHRMFLNVAPTHSIAHSPHKAQHATLTLLKNIPAHAQETIKIPSAAEIENITRLISIQNKRLMQSQRLS